MTKSEAIKLALNFFKLKTIDSSNPPQIISEESYPWGWVFSLQSKSFLEKGELRDSYLGTPNILVDKKDSEVHFVPYQPIQKENFLRKYCLKKGYSYKEKDKIKNCIFSDQNGFLCYGCIDMDRQINSMSKPDRVKVDDYVNNLNILSEDVKVNFSSELILGVLESSNFKQFILDFVPFSQKGLFTFNIVFSKDYTYKECHLVTSPVYPLNVNQLPDELSRLIVKSNLNILNNSIFKVDEIILFD
ncbi:MAG: YrhB domain-containing protein [Saprospiraceae bacterium]